MDGTIPPRAGGGGGRLPQLRRRLLATALSIVASAVVMAALAVLGHLAERGEDHLGAGAARRDARLPGARLTAHEASLLGYLSAPQGDGLDAVGGLERAKDELRASVVGPLRAPRSFFGGPACLEPRRGLLLVGAPGTGKTMLARAIAAEAGARLLALPLSAVENKYVGESGKLLAAAFSLAAKAAPCVLFFDEIDGMMRARSSEESGSSYALKTDFLMQLDGWDARREQAVVVVGSTNNARALDPALKRRLPNVLPVEPPTRAARAHILRLLLDREPEHARALPEAAREALLDGTRGATGSDLRDLYRGAAARRLSRQMREDPRLGPLLQAGAHGPLERAIRPIRLADWAAALEAFRAGRRAAEVDHCTSFRANPRNTVA